MDKEMAHLPKLEKHGVDWRFKKRIPTALLSHYTPKKYLYFQISEPDKKAAGVLALRWLTEH